MKYTPGPWIVDDGDSDAFGVFGEHDGNPICYLSENLNSGTGIRGREEDSANARLIAAAPQLCEALQACVKNWGPRDVFLLPEEKAALQQARAALKAAGVEG